MAPQEAWEYDTRPLYGRILLADDDEGVRRACAGMLVADGMDVVEVEDGQAALDRYRRDPGAFDLVILDVSMPRLDGYQALRSIREFNPGVRAVLTTGNIHDADQLEEVYGAPLLAKPYGSQELRTAVARGLGRRPV